jgi:hypothetical protein
LSSLCSALFSLSSFGIDLDGGLAVAVLEEVLLDKAAGLLLLKLLPEVLDDLVIVAAEVLQLQLHGLNLDRARVDIVKGVFQTWRDRYC